MIKLSNNEIILRRILLYAILSDIPVKTIVSMIDELSESFVGTVSIENAFDCFFRSMEEKKIFLNPGILNLTTSPPIHRTSLAPVREISDKHGRKN
ncbi:MAG: hypothetical protein LBR53_09270 [Deltaproteobacteria bacterium]|jgi:hypothetical protein|nr:hypothetical protein [Deltaproteobacteria bacterium]